MELTFFEQLLGAFVVLGPVVIAAIRGRSPITIFGIVFFLGWTGVGLIFAWIEACEDCYLTGDPRDGPADAIIYSDGDR